MLMETERFVVEGFHLAYHGKDDYSHYCVTDKFTGKVFLLGNRWDYVETLLRYDDYESKPFVMYYGFYNRSHYRIYNPFSDEEYEITGKETCRKVCDLLNSLYCGKL